MKVRVPELVIPQSVPVMVMVPFEGAKLTEPLTVKVPPILKLVVIWVEGVPAMVKPVNVKAVPLLVIFQPVPVMVIVPVGAKVTPLLLVNVPAIEKFALGWLEGVPAMVKPLKVKELLLIMPHPVPAMVMVPLVGARVLAELTVKVPLTE